METTIQRFWVALLVADWLALALSVALVVLDVAFLRWFILRSNRALVARLFVPVVAVVSVPFLYAGYFALQWLFSSAALSFAPAEPRVGSSITDFAFSRTTLMLYSHGSNLWPPAYPGYVVRLALPALLLVTALALAARRGTRPAKDF